MDKPKECFIAFIDIMGFSELVNTGPDENVYEFLLNIEQATKEFNAKFHYDVRIFSDSIIISVPVDERVIAFPLFITFISFVQTYVIVRLQTLPLRGGIVIGNFYTNDDNITFGKGLVEAYESEKKLAVYPRIIVKEDDCSGKPWSGLVPENAKQTAAKIKALASQPNISENFQKLAKHQHNERDNQLRRDFDGLLHCNYFTALRVLGEDNVWAGYTDEYLRKHKEYINAQLKSVSNNKVLLSKYNWMKSYHNWFCTGYSELRKYIMD